MKVINSLKKEELKSEVEKTVEKGATIKTDGSNSYNDLKENYIHKPTTSNYSNKSKLLPWVHTVISNSKRLLLAIHHRVDDDFLQNYLNEFCYKLNRRYFKNIFDRLLIASVSYRWDYFGETCG